jgi:hypothetical protein
MNPEPTESDLALCREYFSTPAKGNCHGIQDLAPLIARYRVEILTASQKAATEFSSSKEPVSPS